MSPASHATTDQPRTRQVLAAWSLVALVFTLGLFSASPHAHAWLHGATALDAAHTCLDTEAENSEKIPGLADADCPILLFAQGVPIPLGLPEVTAPRFIGSAASCPASLELLLSSPRALRPQGRAPPALG